ncbi:hypothetical protein BDZ97DRAFT_1933961 [Flammula alnicola]|nr:hypothetical protein BDZ97DRAFT_1933961 [Flammula alnicola]
MASVDHQRNLPSYPDIMQKVKPLDVIRGAPGVTLANYAQSLEETVHLMSKWSSHTSTVASNPGAAQAVTHVANIFAELQDVYKPYKLSEKAAAVCALHLSIQPRSLKGDILTGPKAVVVASSSKCLTRGSHGKGAVDDFETASAPGACASPSEIVVDDDDSDLTKVNGDQSFSPTLSPTLAYLPLETLAPSAEPSAKFSAKRAEVASKALAHSSDKSSAWSDSESSKRARTEDSYVFGDSAVLVEASDLAVNNAHSQESWRRLLPLSARRLLRPATS